MGLISGLWLVVLGILAAPNLVLSRKPDAKELIANIAKYQGWIGTVSAAWGAVALIRAVVHVRWLAHAPVYWLTTLVAAVLLLALGLLLGVGVLKSFTQNASAHAKLDQTIAKLAPHQGRLGIVAVGVGAWVVIASIVLS